MIQVVEEAANVGLVDPLGPAEHHLAAEGGQRLVCRPPRSETVGAVQEVRLVDRRQDASDRRLKEAIFDRRYPKRPELRRITAFGM